MVRLRGKIPAGANVRNRGVPCEKAAEIVAQLQHTYRNRCWAACGAVTSPYSEAYSPIEGRVEAGFGHGVAGSLGRGRCVACFAVGQSLILNAVAAAWRAAIRTGGQLRAFGHGING